jgi:hypothetical protein
MDEQTAPSFASTWHRAQARSLKPRRAFNLSFATATALLFCALLALALWSKYSQPSPAAIASVSLRPTVDFAKPSDPIANNNSNGTNAGVGNDQVKRNVVHIKSKRSNLSIQRQMLMAENKRVEKNATEITNWQSPTSSLLSSPSDDLFRSLPQLNENANELKSFLPSRENDKEK